MAKRIAMHVVAARPAYLDPSCIPESELDAERLILQEQVANMGKPEHVLAKILDSKLEKYCAERSLATQISVVHEGKRTIAHALKDEADVELDSFAFLLAGGGGS